jgi:prolyl oligopeptidase
MTILSCFLALLILPLRAAGTDPFLWLEDVESPKAMDWVKAHNDKSLGRLTKDPRYAAIEKEVRKIQMAKDRLPFPTLANGWVYNFWQDADHVRGLWRRTRPEEYAKAEPKWEILLDIDRLNKDEGQDWVWEGAACLPPAHQDCLLRLSHGGKDAVVVREFDVAKDTFVADGFYLPEAKTDVAWLDSGRVRRHRLRPRLDDEIRLPADRQAVDARAGAGRCQDALRGPTRRRLRLRLHRLPSRGVRLVRRPRHDLLDGQALDRRT